MNSTTKQTKSLGPIIIIGALFFIFGFITWLNATLIPYLKIACELHSDFQAFFVTFAFYISYFVMALPSSWVLKKTGFKSGMSLGLAIMALGAMIFIPAAMTREYNLFLLGLFVQGTGLAILQTASNPYVTILGPIESAAKRISIMGISNKIAGILSPIILGAIILSDTDGLKDQLVNLGSEETNLLLDGLAAKVILPYIIMGAALFLLAIVIRLSSLPEVNEESGQANEDGIGGKQRNSIFEYPHLLLGVLAIFIYVGVEVISVDTLISYGQWNGFSLSEAKYFSSITLFAMVIGYLGGIITIPRFISQEKALMLCSLLSIVLAGISLVVTGFSSVLSISLLGLSNSLMWPAIWPLAIKGLGKFTKTGSALLIMGIAGGAVMPLLYGKLSDIMGSHFAYSLMIPCYLYILYYSIWGHKTGIKAL